MIPLSRFQSSREPRESLKGEFATTSRESKRDENRTTTYDHLLIGEWKYKFKDKIC